MAFSLNVGHLYNGGLLPVLLAFSHTVNCPSTYTVGLLPVLLDWWPSPYVYCWLSP